MTTTSVSLKSGKLKGKLSRIALIEERWGYLYISSWLLGFLFFQLGPMIASLYFSFTKYEFPLPPKWIGFGNYVKAFAKDELFFKSLGKQSRLL